MGLAEILALVGFVIQEAPAVIQLATALVRMFTGRDTDASKHLDDFERKALAMADDLLKVATRTSAHVETLEFPDLLKGDADARRWVETLETVKAAARAWRESMTPAERSAIPEYGPGQLETIAQLGFANARYGSPLAVPILKPNEGGADA